MKNRIEFVEIPATDFGRAVKFYEEVFGVKLLLCDDSEMEKMALFPDSGNKPNLAISWSDDFCPSKDGVLIHLSVESIEKTLVHVFVNGGRTVREKTKIEADGLGCFALFSDTEGNMIGLYSES